VITLNSGSKVSFRKGLASDKREIVLQGEAFFEVAKDSLRPFIVHTGSISTQALGTSFNINYNLCDTAITVALATGVVKIDKHEPGQQRQIARLAPGQQLSYNKVTQQHEVAPFDSDEVLGWKHGVLSFRQASMKQTIRKLEIWYGVAIEVDTSGMPGEAWNYTGEYDNESLNKVLEGIGFVKDFTYKRTEDKVRIDFN
jgi:ferric-dicitrate binding protein FerR (iron transport regulator)